MLITELLRLAFWTFVLFLALSFFGVSIQAIVNSPIGQANVTFITNLLAPIWHTLTQFGLWVSEWIRPYAQNIEAIKP